MMPTSEEILVDEVNADVDKTWVGTDNATEAHMYPTTFGDAVASL